MTMKTPPGLTDPSPPLTNEEIANARHMNQDPLAVRENSAAMDEAQRLAAAADRAVSEQRQAQHDRLVAEIAESQARSDAKVAAKAAADAARIAEQQAAQGGTPGNPYQQGPFGSPSPFILQPTQAGKK
jgi:hypothetical protein